MSTFADTVDEATQDLVNRYVALWAEPDAFLRRKAVEHLWAPDGEHILKPPQEIRETAAQLGFPGATLAARGHHELEARVARAYDEFIAPGEFEFRLRPGSVDRLANAVKFTWEMLPLAGGPAAGVGTEILILNPDDSIAKDYQFIEG